MGSSIRTIVLAGMAALGIYLGYKFLIPEDVKAKIKGAAEKGIEFGLDMHDKVKGGDAGDEQDRIKANQNFVANQWEQAGF